MKLLFPKNAILFANFFGGSDLAANAINAQKSIILMFGSVFLIYLYFHWLFLEKKDPLYVERFLKAKHGVWFFGAATLLLLGVAFWKSRQLLTKQPQKKVSPNLHSTEWLNSLRFAEAFESH